MGEYKFYRYILRDKGTTNKIDAFYSIEGAEQGLKELEESDKRECIYEPDLYEIYDTSTETVTQ